MKHGILLASLITLAFLLTTTPSHGQQTEFGPSADSNTTTLPNAPSTIEATTCTKKNGTPCPEWEHKWIGQYPPVTESGRPQPPRDPSTVHFPTYRRWQDPPLRTNKQVFHSIIFLGTHAGGAIAMGVACSSKHSGESWGDAVPAASALFGLDYLQYRYIGAPNALVAPSTR